MNGGQSQKDRVLASAERDLRLHKLPIRYQSAHRLTPAEKRRADAEWDAMDNKGRLPEGWEGGQ